MSEVNLYVNGIQSAGSWTQVGTTPYLNAQDQPTNYVHSNSRNANSDVFTFASSSDLGTITKVELFIYAVDGGAASDFEAYVNSTATGLNPPAAWGWVSVDVTSIVGTTWAGVNAATVFFDKSNTTNDPSVDAAYLKVTYTAAVTHPLAGNVAATVTTTGDLDVITELVGSPSVTVTTTGAMALTKGLTGTVTATVTTTGDLDVLTTLAGTIVATSPALTADLTVESADKLIAGEVTVTVTTTGSLDSQPGLVGEVTVTVTTTGAISGTVPLQGSTLATVTTTGDLDVITELQGTITATVVSVGDLAVGTPFTLRTDYWLTELSTGVALAGTATATVTTTGSLEANFALVGLSTVTVTTTGTLKKGLVLSGSSVTLATLSGNLNVSTGLEGSVTVAVVSSGDVKVLTTLAGTATATVTSTGNLTTLGQVTLAGTATATVSTSGDIQVLTTLEGTVSVVVTNTGYLSNKQSVSGTATATVTTSGDLDVITGLTGTVTATVTTTGDLDVLTTLAGTVTAIVTTEGQITTTGEQLLSGTVSATVTSTGDLDVLTTLAGTVTAIVVTTGAIGQKHSVSGTVTVVSTVTGDLDVLTTLAGTATATVTTSGSLSFLPDYLAGNAAATVSVNGALSVLTTLAGTVTATVTTTGAISGTVPLQGTSTATVTTTGDLDVALGLIGASATTVTTTGNVSLTLSLVGAITATVTTTGAFIEYPNFSGVVVVTTTTTGEITVGNLQGVVIVTTTATGTIKKYKSLAGEVLVTVTTSGDLWSPSGLQGIIVATVTTTGQLSGPYAGKIFATVTTTGYLSAIVSLAGEVTVEATIEGEIEGVHVGLRGVVPVNVTTEGWLNSLAGGLVPSWIPTDLEASASITGWVFPAPNIEDIEDITPTFVVPAPTPDFTPDEDAETGYLVQSFLQDYYYRIHIWSNPKNLGAIVSDVSAYVYVWNTFFVEKVLTDVNQSGDYIEVNTEAQPFTFKPLWWEKVELVVSGVGDPFLETEIDFEFDSGATPTQTLLVTGQRLALLYWKPQRNITETLVTKTDVLQSSNGTEQRIQVRPTPRQQFGIRWLFSNIKDAVTYDMFLHRWQKLYWGVPLWQEAVKKQNVSISASDLVIIVDTTKADFRDDSFAFIWKSNTEYATVAIETKTDSQLNLAFPIGTAFTGTVEIMPLRNAQMIARTIRKQHNSGAVEFAARFQVVDNISITGYVPVTTYDGYEVLTQPTFIDPVQHEDSESECFITDYDTGLVEIFSYSSFNKQRQSHIWYNDNAEACWEFRKFLHDKGGQQKSFLVPTFQHELTLMQKILPSDDYIYVESVKMTNNMGVNDLRTYVAFIVDGTVYVRKIVNMVKINDIKERFDIDASLGVTIEMGSEWICFVDKVRFDSDEVTLEWDFAGRNRCQSVLARVT